MATPLQIGSAGMAVGGGLLGGISSYMQGQSTAAQLSFNARQTQIDGQIALQNAQDQAKQLRTQGRMLTGQQRTKYAISGVRMEGTPLDVMANSIANIEMDAINMKQQGIFAQQQAEIQSKFMRKQAKQAKQAGTIGLFSGLLSGGAGAAAMFV